MIEQLENISNTFVYVVGNHFPFTNEFYKNKIMKF